MQEIRSLKSPTNRDIKIGGPQLAAAAIRADLVDEYNLFVVPTGSYVLIVAIKNTRRTAKRKRSETIATFSAKFLSFLTR